jgi:hypothetical protein
MEAMEANHSLQLKLMEEKHVNQLNAMQNCLISME